MIIFRNFFRHGKFRELRISWKKTCLISSKSCQKQGIDLKPSQIFKPTRNVFHFTLGIFEVPRDYYLSMDTFK